MVSTDKPLSTIRSAYVGRFAPSPTGPLHIGSLLAAMASYLQARAAKGRWLVRMEDLDPPREQAGAADDILRTLEAFGFEWDDNVLYQHTRSEHYEAALQQLADRELIYYCQCSRKQIAAQAQTGVNGPVYPGTCRQLKHNRGAIRIQVPDKLYTIADSVQPALEHNLRQETGDFILKRADGLYAYQLAVVIDDADQHITEVVRGSDLFTLTPAQVFLQQTLGLTTPAYVHLPVIINQAQQKLSKQTGARAIRPEQASSLLYDCLHFLHQNPPTELAHETPDQIWRWAMAHWDLSKLPARTEFDYSPHTHIE